MSITSALSLLVCRFACRLAIALALLAPGSMTARAQALSNADRAWIASCADALRAEWGSQESKLRYCTCMHEQFDDNAPVTQTEMERMYPAMHRSCQEESGRQRR